MNHILLYAEEVASDVILKDHRFTHIRDTLRGKVGQKIRVGILNQGVGVAEITAMDRTKIQLKILNISTNPPESLFKKMTLIIAMPRPQTLKKILETSATFGVGEIIFIKTERVEKSFFSSSLLKNDAYKEHLYLGLQQGGYTVPPTISFFQNQKYWEKIPQTSLRWIAHPGDYQTLKTSPLLSHEEPFVIAFGPEGGWRDHEVEDFCQKGFKPFVLGKTIHRLENAVCAALSQVELLLQT